MKWQDKDNIINHFQRIKAPIFIFCYEYIGMLCFIIRSHVRPYQEPKIIPEVDYKMYLSAILLSAYLNLTLAAVCHAYWGIEMTFIKTQLVLSVCFQNLVLAKRDISSWISTNQFQMVYMCFIWIFSFQFSIGKFLWKRLLTTTADGNTTQQNRWIQPTEIPFKSQHFSPVT